jgi:hypothetical protein
VQGVARELRSGIIAHHNRDVDRLRGDRIQHKSGKIPLTVSAPKSNHCQVD